MDIHFDIQQLIISIGVLSVAKLFVRGKYTGYLDVVLAVHYMMLFCVLSSYWLTSGAEEKWRETCQEFMKTVMSLWRN
jgi:TRAP-type C4-dicarboxylate transport system permease large subunit